VSTTDTAPTSSWSGLVDRLAEELGRRWRAGERPAVEEYLDLHLGLRAQPEAAVELIYEELCLRREFGEAADPAEVLRRFPQWHERLRVVLACHNLLEGSTEPARFPAPGDGLAGFRLLAEIGRGAQGRVFLATQPDLADRPVVLKFTPPTGEEHLSLARLQHTHIVPLYSVTEDPDRDLRALCMPYFGGATLARILSSLSDLVAAKRTGAQIVEALRQAQAAAALPVPVGGPACQFLARASYPRAVCWLVACLADALHFAHERGLLHLDLKPSNVLLAADGQPMLLDLHLARGPIAAGAPAPAWLGGTPAYMAPEHRLALTAVREGRSVGTAVDGRADVYALGLLLGEALGGSLPPGLAPGPWLRRRNPQVTVGLADVVARCLAVDPHRRYPNAAALATDLRCHLGDLPLRGVPNRSPLERLRKWRRRSPAVLALSLAGLSLAAAGGSGLVYVGQEAGKARAALEAARGDFGRRDYAAARDECRRGLALVERLPFQHALTEGLRGQLQLVERAETAQELHRFVERVRALYGADGQGTADLRAVEARCRGFWERAGQIVRRLAPRAGAAEGDQVRTDLLDLAVLWTNLRVRLAEKGGENAARREALTILDRAETLFGQSCVLDRERQAHETALGLTPARPPAADPPRTAWEHFAVGRALLRAGDLEAAEASFERALALEDRGLWPRFYQGACAYRRGRHEDAVLAFTACAALAPERAWCWYNRGLAYDAAGRADRALADYDRALRLDPGLAPAALNRGMVHYRAGRHADALADLGRALDAGADPALVDYDRALVLLARGDRGAALDCLVRALRHDPGHEQARTLLRQLRQP
jgi:serine/threonine protein kinase/tetratricopeptide (TPR) repeat protein